MINIEKLIEKKLNQKNKYVVNGKDYDLILEYESIRMELKKTIDDYNQLINYICEKMPTKELNILLKRQDLDSKAINNREELEKEVKNKYLKNPKKRRKNN